MQLVDAIRQAAKNPTPVTDPVLVPESPPVVPPSSATAGSKPVHVAQPSPPSTSVFGGSVVRLELFLSPDQLSVLFRGIIGGAHSVLTLREAAKYVRLSASELEQLCETHQVPAFRLQGKWRFPKAALDDWLAAQSLDPVVAETDLEEDADGS